MGISQVDLFRPGTDGGTKVTLELVMKLTNEMKNQIKDEVGAGQFDLLEALQELIPDAVIANAENNTESDFKGAIPEGMLFSSTVVVYLRPYYDLVC